MPVNPKYAGDCRLGDSFWAILVSLGGGFGLLMVAAALVFVVIGPGVGLVSVLVAAGVPLLVLLSTPLVYIFLYVLRRPGTEMPVHAHPAEHAGAATTHAPPSPPPLDCDEPEPPCPELTPTADEGCPPPKAGALVRDLRAQLRAALVLVQRRREDLDQLEQALEAGAEELDGAAMEDARTLAGRYTALQKLAEKQERLLRAAIGIDIVGSEKETE